MRSGSRNFVVQIDPSGSSDLGTAPLVGRVESLDSGDSTRFQSARVLLRFIRQALAEAACETADRRDET